MHLNDVVPTRLFQLGGVLGACTRGAPPPQVTRGYRDSGGHSATPCSWGWCFTGMRFRTLHMFLFQSAELEEHRSSVWGPLNYL